MMKKIPSGGAKAFSEVSDCPSTERRRKIPPIFLVGGMWCVVTP